VVAVNRLELMMSANEQSATSLSESLPWTRLARGAWYVCAAAAVGIFILSIPAQMMTIEGELHSRLTTPDTPSLLYALNIVSFMGRIAAALISLVLASVLFLKRPKEGMALFLSYFLLVYGAVLAGPLASLEPIWPGMGVFAYRMILPVLFAPLLVAFLSIFPNGRFVPSWTRWLVVVSSLYAPLSPLLFNTGSFSGSAVRYMIGALVWFGLVFAGLYAQAYRYRHVSDPTERQQTKWVVYGFTVALVFAFLTTARDLSLNRLEVELPFPWWAPLGNLGWSLAIAALPVSLTFAVMRYRLYELDIIINRTLLYGALTASVVVIYALLVGVLSALFQARGNAIIALLATALVAVLFQPLRDRLQRGVNRLFYGQRDDPLAALSQLGRRLEAAIAPEIVLPTLVETISQTLKLPYVAISLRSGDEFRIAAQNGEDGEKAIMIPLIYQGKTVGQLIAGPRGPGESFSQADRQLLETIAHQAGPAAYTVQLTQDLRQSRVRLVTAREEERRRVRGDLHDGLGPVLASQGLKLAAVSQLMQDDPAKAERLLEELAVQNEATVAEIRRLVYELRPAALDDLGLVGAVRDYASGLKGGHQDSPRLQIDVRAPPGGLPPLPAAIEVAAYRISTEALTNIARHARARRASVSFGLVSENSRILELEIVDDGIGLPGDHKAGIGLISMRERAEEVGGAFLIESSPGQGTRVFAGLPLAKGPSTKVE
jgi:signal transduction histidine kinase